MKIQIINGPNLNLLGSREPDIYGQTSFQTFFEDLQSQYPAIELSYYQSNIEGELIDKMQEVGFTYDGIILNAGAYTHTSIALLDCIPVSYTHLDVYKRQPSKQISHSVFKMRRGRRTPYPLRGLRRAQPSSEKSGVSPLNFTSGCWKNCRQSPVSSC